MTREAAALACMEKVAQTRKCEVFQLSDQESVIVIPATGFEALRMAFQDSQFTQSLGKALRDAETGDVETLEDEFFD